VLKTITKLLIVVFIALPLAIQGRLAVAESTAEKPEASASQITELVFFTWEDYIDPSLISEFETAYNAKIRLVYYEDDDERDMVLANSNGAGFDLVCIDNTLLPTYRYHDWLSL
jgi:spermidine/putrescine transport system substrate-binding protein